jgi:hypothetical protein
MTHLRIVRGEPTPEELAVVLAVVAAVPDGPAESVERTRRGGWSDRSAQHRKPLIPGPNAWRGSANR